MPRKYLFLLLAAMLGLSGLPIAAAGDVPGNSAAANVKPATVSPAADFMVSQLAQYDYKRYVYKDFCAGENSYTQKAFIGDNYAHIPAMDEAAAGYAGISGISAALDLSEHHWGGYMFVNGGLKAGAKNPVTDFGALKDGVSLTGAVKLVFYAKGQTGNERVEFFMGGLGWQNGRKLANVPYPDSTDKISLGYVHLTRDWKKYEIPLTGADLSHVNCGFGWVTNNTSNPGLAKVAFAVDEIYYVFPTKQSPMVFLPSYAAAKTDTDDYVVNNFAYSYDNAMAVMVLCYAGQPERAKQIADALVYAVHNDRDYRDGRIRNAYSSGDPRSFPNWYDAAGKSFVRLPGFILFKDQQWYEDQGTLATSTGNAAWVILGLMEAYRTIGDESYLQAAQRIGDFVLTLQSNSGGFTGGYENGGSAKIAYKSTEHNIDLIAAFGLLAEYSGGVQRQKYQAAAAYAKSFVLSMYDSRKNCFYTGTTTDGVTPNKAVLPLDVNTWAILAMPDFPDRDKVMAFVENNMKVGGGYDFNTDKDGVWFEGTGQVAVVYKMLGNNDKYNTILRFLHQNAGADGSITAADRDYVTTGFDWAYGKRVHLGATAWLAFAELGRNPLAVH